MSRFYPFFAQNLLLPVYDIARGTSRFKFNHSLQKTQWLSQKEIDCLQTRNLRVLLAHAYETVPYYRRVFREKGLTPSDIKNVDGLVKLPVLTKEDVQRNSGDLISRGFPKSRLISYKSGGTGDQIRFYVTKQQVSWEVAAEFRAYGWAGYRFGDRCSMFWGSPIDLAKHSSLIKQLATRLERILLLNTFVISDEVLVNCARILKRFDPEIVRGYASSVYLMAKFMLEEKIDYIRPRAVITSAETLFDPMRRTIEEAFGCPVFDYYGSREVGAIAGECEEHNGYHITAENVVLEFVKEGEHVTAGERGLILVTSLRNFGMPFIRYKIGDVGIPSDENCNCGRGLPLMSSIEGRMSDFMAVYDPNLGRVVPVGPVYPIMLYALMSIPLKNVRIIQESLKKVIVKAVKDKGYSPKHTDLIISNLQRFLGTDITVEIDFVDSLPPMPSGKRSAFVSKINPFEQKQI